MRRRAYLSPCGTYRYHLLREWADGPRMTFVMLNPSTADHEADDPTTTRCEGFARREGCGSYEVVNLCAFRATKPPDLMRADDPVGSQNDTVIKNALDLADGPIVCAWGRNAHRLGYRVRKVKEMLDETKREATCLGLTKDGHPRHPLMLASVTPLQPYYDGRIGL